MHRWFFISILTACQSPLAPNQPPSQGINDPDAAGSDLEEAGVVASVSPSRPDLSGSMTEDETAPTEVDVGCSDSFCFDTIGEGVAVVAEGGVVRLHARGTPFSETIEIDGREVHFEGVEVNGELPSWTSRSASPCLKLDESSVSMTDIIFADCEAVDGGALFVDASQVSLRQMHFVGNRAVVSGGALFARDSVLEIIDSVFEGNRCSFFDPSYCQLQGGALYLESSALDSQRSVFFGNFANEGGALYLSRVEMAVLEDTSITGNSSLELGSAAYLRGSSVDVYSTSDDIDEAWADLSANISESGDAALALVPDEGTPSSAILVKIYWHSGFPLWDPEGRNNGWDVASLIYSWGYRFDEYDGNIVCTTDVSFDFPYDVSCETNVDL